MTAALNGIVGSKIRNAKRESRMKPDGNGNIQPSNKTVLPNPDLDGLLSAKKRKQSVLNGARMLLPRRVELSGKPH